MAIDVYEHPGIGTFVTVLGKFEGFTVKLPAGMSEGAVDRYVGELREFYE